MKHCDDDDKWFNTMFWPTELAYRFRRCWTPLMMSYNTADRAKERPPRPFSHQKRRKMSGPKRLQLQPMPHRNTDPQLPF